MSVKVSGRSDDYVAIVTIVINLSGGYVAR